MTVGHLTSAQLVTVQGSIALGKVAAADFRSLKAEVKRKLGRTIAIAGPAGGYRSEAVQHAMHLAGAGSSAAAKVRWGLNPRSTVAIADHPLGTHEDGLAFDVVGTPLDSAFLAIALKWGFKLQFPGRDPNHLRHYGAQRTKPVVAAVHKVTKPASAKVTYVVRSGDTLTKIAALYSDPRDKKVDVDVEDLLRLNPGIVPTALRIGQKVRVA
jgi:LysM repeat protein